LLPVDDPIGTGNRRPCIGCGGIGTDQVAKSAPEVGVKDTAAVDVRNWHSMQYWAKWLGISEQQLIRATRVAGTNVALIEAHLAERRAKRQRKRMHEPEPA